MGSVVTGMMLNAFTINREIGIVQISEDFSGRCGETNFSIVWPIFPMFCSYFLDLQVHPCVCK